MSFQAMKNERNQRSGTEGPDRRTFLSRALGVTAGLAGAAAAGAFGLPASAKESNSLANQSNWRFCAKCYGLFYYGFQDNGRCPAGGAHSRQTNRPDYDFVIPHGVPETPTAQRNWRFCVKCYDMFYYGFQDNGHCPAGGAHSRQPSADYDFVIPHDVPETPTAQRNWRFCAKCYVMFFYGFQDNGRCAAGGAHSRQTNRPDYDFVLPHL
ncbi:hypothetical protein ACFYM0_28770 [Streptomyces sp. NPDC006487]|uniref:hypothetical protein n=1 Tax=Streptomyces sp. NPDC006487 TaxID=3364748 RepID=UPI0036799791